MNVADLTCTLFGDGEKNHQMVWGNVAMLVGEHCELSIAMLDCWGLTSSCLCLEPILRSKSF